MRSRTAQLIFQTFYCALALTAIIGSVGINGMVIWIAALLAAFIVGGGVFLLADRLLKGIQRKN